MAICTDHGREFDNEVQFGAFCDANGITHNFSAPRTPNQKGTVLTFYTPYPLWKIRRNGVGSFTQHPRRMIYTPYPDEAICRIQEVILFYKGLDVPTRQILDSKGAIPSMKVVDAKKSIQDMADHS
ncbi:hypothetical protein Tco_0899536 [Tanacetum coccineum]